VGDSGSDSFLSSQSADPFTLCFPQPLCDLAEGVIHIAILGQAASVEPQKRQKGPRGGRWAPPYGQEVGPRACVRGLRRFKRHPNTKKYELHWSRVDA
jgi:hypothetical protein